MSQTRDQASNKAERLPVNVLAIYRDAHELGGTWSAKLLFGDLVLLDNARDFINENRTLFPFGCDLHIGVSNDEMEVVPGVSVGAKDRSVNERIQALRDKFPNCQPYSLTSEEFAYFKKLVDAYQLNNHIAGLDEANFDLEYKYNAVVLSLYKLIQKSIGDVVITPEMMDQPDMALLLATKRLDDVMCSDLSREVKIDAINNYREMFTESLGSKVARAAIAVLFAAAAAVGLGVAGLFAGGGSLGAAGAIAGVAGGLYVANKVCKATFFAKQTAVDEVVAAALDELIETAEPEENVPAPANM